MIKGTIQQVEIKDTQYRVQINNIWYGVFDNKYWEFCKVGNEIEFTFKQNGNYKNINHLVTNQKPVSSQTTNSHSATEDKILKSLCLKIAGNSFAGYDVYKPNQILSRAKSLYEEIKKDGWL